MNTANTTLIDLHNQWLETGRIFGGKGLCYAIPAEYLELFSLFEPTQEEKYELDKQGYCRTYWASGLPYDDKDEQSAYTPLRQAIVLFICAMADEI